MKRSLSILSMFLLVLAASSCVYAVGTQSEYVGKVVDEKTGEPVAGVVVLGTWYKVNHWAAGPQHVYFDASETVTDRHGEFRIQRKDVAVGESEFHLLIFKAGYSYEKGPWTGLKKYAKYIKWEGDKPTIPIRKLTLDEREEMLSSPPMPPTEASKDKVIRMLEEINKELIEQGLKPYEVWKGEKI